MVLKIIVTVNQLCVRSSLTQTCTCIYPVCERGVIVFVTCKCICTLYEIMFFKNDPWGDLTDPPPVSNPACSRSSNSKQ